jgi:NitT/TauT family transport system permease protein
MLAYLTLCAALLAPGIAHAVDVKNLDMGKNVQVWYVEDHTLPMIAMTAALPAGSAYDPSNKGGLATFTASLLNEGAGNLNSQAYQSALTNKAIRLNVTPTRDYLIISLVTLSEILLGFGLTLVTAIPLGLLIALSLVARQVVYPPLMLMQLVPKIAVAPLFLVWLGFGMESKVLLTVLMTFFPLLLASISGFQILDNRFLFLTESMGATKVQTFRYLRFPAALPVIFSGIKTSATIAATAAIVAEFVGANKGLGYVLLRGTGTMDIELVFAVLVVLTIIGIAINYLVEFSEWVMTPWQRSKNN